jgi:hypothetical protein
MAKRARLYDKGNQYLGLLSYREIDDYIQRGLVERLTPINAKLHCFRFLCDNADAICYSSTSLTAFINEANAGAASSIQIIVRARRKVRIWPFIVDRLAQRA